MSLFEDDPGLIRRQEVRFESGQSAPTQCVDALNPSTGWVSHLAGA